MFNFYDRSIFQKPETLSALLAAARNILYIKSLNTKLQNQVFMPLENGVMTENNLVMVAKLSQSFVKR